MQRDFENSLRCLSNNGFIVIHDVLPTEEITTCIPRGNQKIWHGDVYKFAMTVCNYNDISFKTFDIDNGCMVIQKIPGRGCNKCVHPTSWKDYLSFGHSIMNVTSTVEI